MKTYNQHFNDAWEYLEQYNTPALNKSGLKWDGFPCKYTLDMSNKPKITVKDWKYYIDAVTTILTIGRRENFLTIHVDGQGSQVFWTVDKPNTSTINREAREISRGE